eukprot:m.436658 g.436658  ORF g.436658 m.436658 type:complete len:240 (-) comp18002_c0_seq1:288-1007(-)
MAAMMEEEMEIPMKVLIVGNGAVGKSSMMRRYCKGVFTNDYKKTIGVDFLEKQLSIGGEDVRLMIWDTAGQEEFGKLTRAYYQGAHACVVAFSTTDRDSFDEVESWIEKVEEVVQDIPMVLVQNKVDLIKNAVMSKEEAEAKAAKVKLTFYRTSVQDNFMVDEVFKYLAEQYLQKVAKEKSSAAAASGDTTFGDTGAGAKAPKGKGKMSVPANDGRIRLDAPSKNRTGGKKKKGCKDCG